MLESLIHFSESISDPSSEKSEFLAHLIQIYLVLTTLIR